MNNIFKRVILYNNIEYIILSIILFVSLVVRFYRINNPVADWHSFRQADTSSVTRVFKYEGIKLIIPRYYDVSTTQSGIFNPKAYRFVEFPIFNLLHLYINKMLPTFTLDVSGRLVSIFASSVSAYLVFLITKKIYGRKIGLISVGFYAFLPFNIYFTRVILPEPLAVTFALLSLWLFLLFTENNHRRDLVFSGLAFSSALLIKPHVFFFAIPMFYLYVRKFSLRQIHKKADLYLWVFLVMVPFVLWRIWMQRFPEGIPFWKWIFNGDGIRFKPAFWRWIFGERLTSLILGYWGLIPFFLGLISVKSKQLFHQVFLLGVLCYVTVFATANVRHDYYQTVTIPAVVICVSLGLCVFWNLNLGSKYLNRVLLIFTVLMTFSSSFVQIKEFYKINRPEIIEAGIRADAILPKNALVIAPYNGDTAFLYQTKRRGWPVVDRPIEELISKGAQYFISVDLEHYQTVEFSNAYQVVEKTQTYVIVDLTQKSGI